MCTFAAAAPAALAIGGQVAGFVGQNQAASAQSRFQNARYSAVAANALSNYSRNVGSLQERAVQEQYGASQQAMESAGEAASKIGTLTAASGATGVSGNSIEALLHDFSRVEAENAFAIQTNYNWRVKQMQEEARGFQARAQSEITAATPQPVARPSPLALALNIGYSVMGGMNTFYQQASPAQQASLKGGWMFGTNQAWLDALGLAPKPQ